MAVAPAIGKRGDLALAENSQFRFCRDAGCCPAPAVSDSYWNDDWPAPLDRAKAKGRTGAVPLPRQAPWPRQMPLPLQSAAIALPVPAQSVFELRDRPQLAARAVALPSRRVRTNGICQAWQGWRTAGLDGGRRVPAGGRRKAASRRRQPGSRVAHHRSRKPACGAARPAFPEAVGSGQERERVTDQSVTILATQSSTTMARKNRSI